MTIFRDNSTIDEEMMGKNGKAVICVSTREASLKKRLRRHLKSLGFHKTDDGTFAPPGAGKDVIRTIHSVQRDDRLAVNRRFISENFSGLIKYFASGKDVNVARISPMLQRISGDTWESDLFRLAALTWSVPVSNGFGRRLRLSAFGYHEMQPRYLLVGALVRVRSVVTHGMRPFTL